MRIWWFLSQGDARAAARKAGVRDGAARLRSAVESVIEPLEGRRLLSGGPGSNDDTSGAASGEGPDVPPPDVAPPAPSIPADSITTAGGSSVTISVAYADDVAVDGATIDADDLV